MIHLHELHTRRSGLIAAAVLGLVALLTAAFWDYTQDDVFITFAYSRNIAQGEGFVFNPGEHVQGSTTPLWALLLAGVYWITPDLLHAGNLLSGLFLLVTAGFAVDLLRRDTSFFARAALAITLAVSPLIYVSYGMETLFYCAILTGGLWLWHRDRRPAAMIAAAALTWTRADGVVLAGAFGLIALWDSARAIRQDQAVPLRRPWRGLPWRLGLTYIAGIAPWFLFAWAYFGTPLPQTFSAKEEFLQGTRFVRVGADWWDSFYGNNPLTLLAVPLIVLGAWRALISPGLRPLVLWAGLYTTGYTALNVTAFWYYTPLLVALILLAALGGDWLARRLVHAAIDRRIVFGDRRVVVGGAVGLVLICAGLAFVRAWDNHKPPPRMVAYETAGRWIDAHAGPDDSLLVKDLGIVGYYADRYTLDSFGLIVPDMHYTHDTYAAAKYKTDWVLTTQYWAMKQLVEQDWFHYHYAPLAQFSAPGDHEFSPMTAYRRRLDTAPPGQIVSGFDLPLTCIVSLEKGEPVPAKTRARLLDVDGVIRVEAAHPFLWGQYPDS
ncbi:MAG: hypothetical protein JW966_09085, partial [Anaerolineae bacterium]|nr:hypothetical protein [Anaerolineae bacterium]